MVAHDVPDFTAEPVEITIMITVLLIFLAFNLIVNVLIIYGLFTVARYVLETSPRALVNNSVVAGLLTFALLISPNVIAHVVFYGLAFHLGASDTTRALQTPPYRPRIVELVQELTERRYAAHHARRLNCDAVGQAVLARDLADTVRMTLRFKGGPPESLSYAMAKRERCAPVGEWEQMRTIKEMAANGHCIVGVAKSGGPADVSFVFDHRTHEQTFELLTGQIQVRRLQITEKAGDVERIVLRRTALSADPIAAMIFGYGVNLGGGNSSGWGAWRVKTAHNPFEYGWTVIRYLEAVRAGKARGTPVPPLKERGRFPTPRHEKLDPKNRNVPD